MHKVCDGWSERTNERAKQPNEGERVCVCISMSVGARLCVCVCAHAKCEWDRKYEKLISHTVYAQGRIFNIPS